MKRKLLFFSIFIGGGLASQAQINKENDSTLFMHEELLDEVTIKAHRPPTSRMKGAANGVIINKDELFKAACCNLGESFVTNPSVDVSYSDAATGAKQIKLLGLSGTYVQMLTETLPNFRGAAAPYALGYVPGAWMKSIQVSKGSSSVKNGYESITGQINVEYLKPEDEQGATANVYANTMGRFEANADGNIHLTDAWSTELLTHFENDWSSHDSNDDGFLDQPKIRQYNVQNRWHYMRDHYIFHGGLGALKEDREGGQTTHAHPIAGDMFHIGIDTKRYEGYMKHAFILDHEHGTNIAFMLSGSMHEMDASYGYKAYSVNQKNAYAQVAVETSFTDRHSLSAGLSLNHDYYGQQYDLTGVKTHSMVTDQEKETVPGVYAQYTYNLDSKVVAMAGIRADHSSEYGTFLTPRLHLKYMPVQEVSFRLSAGKGYRAVHALAENNYLMATGRQLVINKLKQEEAWNYGISTAVFIPLFDETLTVNAEYYYTDFDNQAVVDYDSDSKKIHIGNLQGKSYSHTFQVDASYPLFEGMTLTAAYRRNKVKSTYGGRVLEKPLTNKYKGLVTASYKTALGIWQFDATLQLNGGGRMPTPYLLSDGISSWNERFHAYEQLSAQVTRWFRHFSVYVGGENLTGFKQKHPIIGAENPWGTDFEPTLVWGPVTGAMFYAGIRINVGRL